MLQHQVEKLSTDTLKIPVEIRLRLSGLEKVNAHEIISLQHAGDNFVSMLDLFMHLHISLAGTIQEYKLRDMVGSYLKINDIRAHSDTIMSIIHYLAAENLIDVENIQSGNDGRITSKRVFRLTEYGKQCVFFSRLTTQEVENVSEAVCP
jgi:hypothetical protein